MKDYLNLTDLQIDTLKEISNIGAGNAATSLSMLLNRKIDMSVPKATIAPFSAIPDIVGGAEQEVAGGFLKVDGDCPMEILFLIPKDQVFTFIDMLFGRTQGSCTDWGEMEISAFKEIVNILAGSYLNALATFTNHSYFPSVPAMASDMAGAILGEVLQQIGEVSDYALLMENAFIEQEQQINGYIFLLPEPQALDILLQALGVL